MSELKSRMKYILGACSVKRCCYYCSNFHRGIRGSDYSDCNLDVSKYSDAVCVGLVGLRRSCDERDAWSSTNVLGATNASDWVTSFAVEARHRRW